MKRTILTVIFFCITAAIYASDTLIVHKAVFFDVDKSELDATARQSLDSMVRSLRDQGECSVSIYGSTDIDGSAGYNQKLSERRAHAVQDYLLSQNIKAVKCETRGLGRKGDQYSKTENRRVDVDLRFTYFTGVADLYRSLSKDADQTFVIDPNVPNEIKCRDNTKITIPAGSLRLPNGQKPNGKVSITVREAINTADILSLDLSSVSDDRLLETRGMVYISASSGGQQLSVDSASPVSISIPSMNVSKDMKVFYGERKDGNSMNWKVADASFKPDVKIVPINIDRSSLSAMYIKDKYAPIKPRFEKVDAVPAPPTKPRQPIQVKEPERSNSYKGTALERVFNKKKIIRKNEDIYQQALKRYNESMEKQQEYQVKMRDYGVAMKAYDEKMRSFAEEGKHRLEQATVFFNELYQYNAATNINKLINSVQTMPLNNKTVLTGYLDSRYYQTPDFDRKEVLREIIGETYYRYFHYNEPNGNIDYTDNMISRDTIAGKFKLMGYTVIYDSMLHITHLDDTLAMLQERITSRCVEMGLFNQNNVAGYIASVSQLGWINCDRFTQTPPNQLATMNIKEKDEVKMYIVFNDLQSYLPMYRKGNEYSSSPIPKGKNVKVVAVKVVEGKPQMAISTINTSHPERVSLQYKTCSLKEIKNSFAAL